MRHHSEPSTAPRSRPMSGRMAVSCVVLMFCAGVAGCDGPGPARVGEATLAVLALGTDPLPKEAEGAPVVEVLADVPPTIPNAPVVKLAIDRGASWGLVQSVLFGMQSRGQKPVILVAEGRTLRAFHLEDELDGPHIEVWSTTEGMVCVRRPDLEEAKCAQVPTESYIDPAATRELVREAVTGYERTNIEVELPQGLRWADVVSTVGGARSCCSIIDIDVRVKLKGSAR